MHGYPTCPFWIHSPTGQEQPGRPRGRGELVHLYSGLNRRRGRGWRQPPVPAPVADHWGNTQWGASATWKHVSKLLTTVSTVTLATTTAEFSPRCALGLRLCGALYAMRAPQPTVATNQTRCNYVQGTTLSARVWRLNSAVGPSRG